MNRLQICQKVHRLIRGDNNLPGTAPTTTLTQTGILGEMVNYVDDAYQSIQGSNQYFHFRQKQGTFSISIGQRVYTLANIVSQISDYEMLLPFPSNQYFYLLNGTSDAYCNYVHYEHWRGYYDRVPISEGTPSMFTVRPDQSIEFNVTPIAEYTIKLDYRASLVAMTADASVPVFAADYHDAIVWLAIVKYCEGRDGAGNLYDLAKLNYTKEYDKLCLRYLPKPILNGSLYWGRYS